MEEAVLKSNDLTFTGRSVSRGIGFGKVLCLFGSKRQFYRKKIEPGRAALEIKRLHEAVKIAEAQLESIIAEAGAGDAQAGIFETHLLFLQDSSLLRKIEATITELLVNAEWAVSRVIEEYVSKYKLLTDRHLREKYIDLEDVGDRLIATLAGSGNAGFDFEEETVVVANEIHPSTLIGIGSRRPVALVTERGGWTSHTFILARELGIPAVTGIHELLRQTETGNTMMVDGFHGTVVVNPSNSTVKGLQQPGFEAPSLEDGIGRGGPLIRTLDGVDIRISANLDLTRDPDELSFVKELGVGLYRSEYFFDSFSGYPTEEEQTEKYKEVLELAGQKKVKIRTFDLGIGEFAGRQERTEKNPALGLRGIRLSLRYEVQFRTQIRALLRAGVNGDLDVVLPMISGIAEFENAKRIFEEEKRSLDSLGVETVLPRIGAMIEVPSAVLVIRDLVKTADFVNIGTNDLVQYLLAVDRDNDDLAEHFRTLHPAVLRALEMIFAAGIEEDKEVVVCGEMAGSVLYVPILIGLGARVLSMNVSSMRRVAHVVENISVNEAEDLADVLTACRTVLETEEAAVRIYLENWPHLRELLDPAIIPA